METSTFSPFSKNAIQNRKSHFLKILLHISIPASIFVTFLAYGIKWHEGVAASLTAFIFFVLSFFLLHLKKTTIASLIYLSGILLASLISSYYGGNIFDTTLYLIPILIVTAGLLLEKNIFMIFTAGSLLLTTAVTFISWRNFRTLPSDKEFAGALILFNLFIIFTIITTRILIYYLRKSNNEARLSEEKFRTITEKLNLGIFTYTENGILNYANDYLCRKIGYSREELLTKNFIDLIHPDHKELVLKRAKGRLEGKDIIDNYEIKVIFKDGSTHWIALSASKVNVQNTLLGLGGIIDVTRRKELEQQVLKEKEQVGKVKKLESLGVLAGGIAHDFNNLLTGILGNISLIEYYLNENDSIKITKSLKNMQQVIKRASGLTHQLLTFSKGGAPVLKVASLENIIKDTTRFVLSGSNVEYNIKIEDNLWKVNIDTGQISQVIQNLVINANQAMKEEGRIDIKLENKSIDKNIIISGTEIPYGNYVQIEIKDIGSGIPKDILNKIFDPYFSTKETGNGLGLSTVYSIIEQHNGFITVNSIQGKGTEINLYFPRVETDTPQL